ncbi:MAG: hypothetical protein PHU93_00610 [Candidatus Gracilibacteria bacterium]|nr:hypothetical protein [Candidatus Gracilibacteria bacterium]
MNFFGSIYAYDTASLLVIHGDDIIYIGVISVIGVITYFVLPIIKKILDERKKLKTKTEKKKFIEELIMMKEIQGEIEQEMREALIHSELRSKKEHGPAV